MLDEGHMNYFNVEKCGLYKMGSTISHGCELEETFDLISKWVKNRSFALTIPWDPELTKKNQSKCYCKDIYKDSASGDFFVVLWKSDTDKAGTLWGAQEDNEIGSGKVVKYTNEYKGKKVIWGRPCYYWVIPKYNTVVSIKFDHSVCDAQLFEDYVISCINNRVKHDDRKKTTTDKGYVRIEYRDDDTNSKYSYRFKKSLKSLHTSSLALTNLASKVTHIIRRETIRVNSPNERAEWVNIFNRDVPFIKANSKFKTRRIEVKAEAKPTAEEITEIIEKNAKESRKSGDWDNVGFAIETGVTWVDRYRLRTTIKVIGKKNSLYTAAELYDEINKKRLNYINPIRLSHKIDEKTSKSANIARAIAFKYH